jgi:uracil-DNA glycosylase
MADSAKGLEASLALHRQALAACRACGLPSDVVPIVSCAVRPKAMLVGQAPGQVEAAGGKPFAGRAGKTLFRWFERTGIDEATARSRIYIAAVTRCYPGPSPSGRGDRVPSPAEQDKCSVWLEQELRMIRPRVLIPVGRLAIARFLPNLPLDEIVGRAFDVEHVGGKSVVIPLPHPSGASSWIHQGDHPKLLDRALAKIRNELRKLGVGSGPRGRSAA